MNLSIKNFQEFSFCNRLLLPIFPDWQSFTSFLLHSIYTTWDMSIKTKQSGNIVFSTVKCNALLFLLFVQISELDFLLGFLGLDFTHIKLKFFALKYVTITSSTLARSWRHTCCRRKNLKCLKTMKKEDHDNNVPPAFTNHFWLPLPRERNVSPFLVTRDNTNNLISCKICFSLTSFIGVNFPRPKVKFSNFFLTCSNDSYHYSLMMISV